MEGDIDLTTENLHWYISIHSLRMEGDFVKLDGEKILLAISIHSLRMEGDSRSVRNAQCDCISIHSLRMEGDCEETGISFNTYHFNPLPPHGGRRRTGTEIMPYMAFQSTPSAWRETVYGAAMEQMVVHFNPLPPHGGRPFAIEIHILPICISIHSLRMEGDGNCCAAITINKISIHSLRMEGDFLPFSL